MDNIIVKVKDMGEVSINQDSNLLDLAKLVYKEDYKSYLGARINNEIFNLNKELQANQEIIFLDNRDVDGYRIYTKTISAIFIMACKELYPDSGVTIQHFLGSGLYAQLENKKTISFKKVIEIEKKMNEIIEKDYKIERIKYDRAEALDIFEREGYYDKFRLLNSISRERMHIYNINGHIDSFHGFLAPSTGYVNEFKLKYYYPGVIMLFPSKKNDYNMHNYKEQPKLSKIFKEANDWADILDLAYVGSLNEKIRDGKVSEVIKVSEALQEKKIGQIADMICEDEDISIILVAGPSSSGKTTFAERLSTHLKVNGKRPVTISVDDYFINRDDTPLDEYGEYDFESINAIDLELLNTDLVKLLEGEEVRLPKFNFITGTREVSDNIIKVDKNHPIIIEGIHGLNSLLTRDIPEKNKFKIYISALTQLNIDAHNRIPTTDTRLIRRMVRDVKYRGNDPIRTFELWSGVRRGEEKYIFPFQEEADVMFDSALVYELAVLKKHIVPLLEEIDNSSIYYSEAKKLIKFLQYFLDIEDESEIPPNSLLKEFL